MASTQEAQLCTQPACMELLVSGRRSSYSSEAVASHVPSAAAATERLETDGHTLSKWLNHVNNKSSQSAPRFHTEGSLPLQFHHPVLPKKARAARVDRVKPDYEWGEMSLFIERMWRTAHFLKSCLCNSKQRCST